jgi:hypothetical protein
MKTRPADIQYGGLNAYRIKNAKPVFNEKTLEIFKHFVSERYKIHLLKDVEKKPFPWTKDMILSMYKFTNVRREQDRNSRYLIDIMKKHGDCLTYEMFCNIIAFRLFNRIETYELFGGWVDFENYDAEDIRRKLLAAPKGQHFFTNAYMCSGTIRYFKFYFPEEKSAEMRVFNVVKHIFGKLYESVRNAKSPQEVIDLLKTVGGINDFLAYQLFVDFTYLSDFQFSENEFVLSGPGCSRGLSYLFKDKGGLKDEELLFWLRDNCPITPEWCMENMTDLPEYDRCMNVMSLENCMCELSKYMRAVEGTGRPRCLYKVGGR